MKKVIVCLFLCMILIPNFIVSAERIDNTNASDNNNDDVPIWNNGDSWTYTVNEFSVNFEYQGNSIQMAGRIDDFIWTVSDTSGSTYTVAVTGQITATYAFTFLLGNLFISGEGSIAPPLIKLKGNIIFDKSDLEIIDFNAEITGITSLIIQPLPIKIPVPIRISADPELSTQFPLFNFPLHILKLWDMPNMDIVANVNFGGIFGILKIPITIYTHYDWFPFAFSCLYKENIHVEAGDYDAWRIKSLIGGFFEYYYAPSVGNLVKIDVNMPRGGIKGELKATNY